MSIKYITDDNGIKTDVVISYNDWQIILDSHIDMKNQFKEDSSHIAEWQKEIVRNIIKTTPRKSYSDWELTEEELDKEIL